METAIKGFSVKTVAARIADMDFDAAGNSERAAWKRYLALCLLAIAKAEDKKALQRAVFGDGRVSKTFQNMWSLANKCRFACLGNREWSEVLTMGIDDAMGFALERINVHMATLHVSSKNAYEPLSNLTPAEVEAKRKADAARTETDADEKPAKVSADSQPERSTIDAVMDALHGASLDERMAIMGLIAQSVGVEPLRIFAENVIATLNNAAAAEARENTTPSVPIAA